MPKLSLPIRIILGLSLGVGFGLVCSILNISQFVIDWIKPFGVIFINLLKAIAIPLVIVSIIKGIADLKDISKFSALGSRTIVLYLVTTVFAITLGLGLVNLIKPGAGISEQTVEELASSYGGSATQITGNSDATSSTQTSRRPLQFLVEIVPENIFAATSSNRNMLQIIFVSVLFGLALLLVPRETSAPINTLIESLNIVIIKIVDLIMLTAPFAVFCLLAALVNEITSPDLFIVLIWYALTVVLGLISLLVFYSLLLYWLCSLSPIKFFKGLLPAQLVAFSTSSSAATLAVTINQLEKKLGVKPEVAGFVCPLGATINMDGTGLHQAVAAVFICQALHFDLSFSAQLTIILTATLASIGSAAVPSAGIVMLVIVLESVGLPSESLAVGIALIIAVDRPLDMLRTVVNISGDATVALLVNKKQLVERKSV